MRYIGLILIAAFLGFSTLGLGQGSATTVSTTAAAPQTKPTDEAPASRPASRPASQPSSQPATRPASGPSTQVTSAPTTATAPATQPAKPKDRYLAIRGGIIHPVSGPDLRSVTILCKNGKIQAIGRNVNLPDETEMIDATGLRIYPGLVASNTSGLVGSKSPEDSTDVFSTNMRLANAGGLTTVLSRNTAAKLTFGTLEDHVLRKDLFVQLRYRGASGKRKIREALDKVRRYLREKEIYDRKKAEGDEEAEPPDEKAVKGKNEQYLKLIKREKAALIQADTRRELLDVCDLASGYGIRVVVRGATEGWTVAGRLGRAGIKAIVTPRRVPARDERKNQPHGGNIENAALLYGHGVDLAVTTSSTGISLGGLAGQDLLTLPMEAAYAVRGGLSEPAAIETITLGAARLLGIDDRVGSIEVGKDADFILCDGRLLDFFTTVQQTIVNGRVVYDKREEHLFAHIRPRAPTTQPAPFRFWPRPFPTSAPESNAGADEPTGDQ